MKLKSTIDTKRLDKILKEKGFLEEDKSADFVIFEPKSAPTRGHRKKVFSGLEVDKLKRMKRDGMSNRSIAKEMNVSEKTIRNYLKS